MALNLNSNWVEIKRLDGWRLTDFYQLVGSGQGWCWAEGAGRGLWRHFNCFDSLTAGQENQKYLKVCICVFVLHFSFLR